MAVPNLLTFSPGVGVFPSDWANGVTQSGALLTNLRNFVGVSNMTVYMIGTATADDGGEGLFYWNATATAADDGGATTIAPNGVTVGRWLRLAPSAFAATGTFTDTAMNIGWSFLLNGISPTTEYTTEHVGDWATQALVSGVAIPSTATVTEADGSYSYVNNASTTTNAVGYGCTVRGLAAGVHLFGLNPLVDDGGFASTVVGCEWDIGGKSTASIVYGNNMIGVFPNGTPATAVAYQVSALDPHPWQIAFLTGDGAATTGLQLGAQALTASSNGQAITLAARDASNVSHAIGIQAIATTAGANLNFATPTGQSQFTAIQSTGLATFSAALDVAAASGALAGFFSGSTGVGSITTNGTTTTYNTTSDERLKDDAGPIQYPGETIDAIKPRWFRWKSNPRGPRQPGFFAQQVDRIFPWAVTRGHGEPGDDDFKPWQLDAGALMPMVIAELQYLRQRVAELEARR